MALAAFQTARPSAKTNPRARRPGSALIAPHVSPRALHPVVQAKLRVGAPDDKYEQEADHVAEQVMRMPEPAAATAREPRNPPSKPVAPHPPLGHPGGAGRFIAQRKCAACAAGGTECPECEDDEFAEVQTDAPGNPSGIATVATDLVKPPDAGSPLAAGMRTRIEPMVGADLGNVRIHSSPAARATAAQLGAAAFTHQNHIWLGPHRRADDLGLLAHEATHVVQQTGGSGQDPARAGGWIQRLSCREILDAPEAARVNGMAAHSLIKAQFVAQYGRLRSTQRGAGAIGLRIPGASSTAYRTETCGDPPSDSIDPLPDPDEPRTGAGEPDLALRDSQGVVHLAEIKVGTYECRDLAIRQLDNYVGQGNADDSRISAYRRARFIDRFVPMSPALFSPVTPIPAPTSDGRGVEPTSVAWCGDGQIIYKAVRDADPDIIACGESDHGAVDEFLDRVLGAAQSQADAWLDEMLMPMVDQALANLTLRDALLLAWEHGREPLRQIVVAEWGETAWAVIEALDPEAAINQLATLLEELPGGNVDEMLRQQVERIKALLLARIRAKIQEALRAAAQSALAVACEAAAAVSVAQVVAELIGMLPQVVAQAIEETITELAQAAAVAAAVLAVIVLVIALIVIVAIVVLAWEAIAAGGLIGGAGAATTGGGATVVGTGAAVTTTAGATTAAGGGTVIAFPAAATATEVITKIAAGILLAIGGASAASPAEGGDDDAE